MFALMGQTDQYFPSSQYISYFLFFLFSNTSITNLCINVYTNVSLLFIFHMFEYRMMNLQFVELTVLVWVSELLFWLPFSCCHWMYSVNAIKETIDWTHYCLISPPTAISLPAERVYSETGDNKGDLLPLLSFISPQWTSLLILSYLPSINFGPSPLLPPAGCFIALWKLY